MISISLCMIVKNEEKLLSKCLDGIKELVDEIVIVDTGSTDRTIEIAKKYTNSIYNFQWVNDFSAARNFAFSKATKEYIFWLDADDIITEDNKEKFKTLKQELSNDIDYVTAIYDYSISDDGKVLTSFRLNRIVKNFKGFYWHNIIHEDLIAWGNKIDSAIHLTHLKNHYDCERNINFIRQKMNSGYFLTHKENLLYGQELFYAKYYDDTIRVFKNYLKHLEGTLSDRRYACRMLSNCYDIKGDYENALSYLIDCFKYGPPYDYELYKLATFLQSEKRYEEAIYWYKHLISCPDLNNDYENWIKYLPHQQLCCCYYELGDLDNSNKHNEMAANFNPNDPYVVENRQLFKSLGFNNDIEDTGKDN
ncbi:glycosyltransferase family 2 protein [Clostridium sp.]|uniref:tetratricopeptide repeat-containing glycosyltransferase family 2 protein n=1 Tax=Clostridium sp. TaxID=1506 RepID=UPI002FC888D3